MASRLVSEHVVVVHTPRPRRPLLVMNGKSKPSLTGSCSHPDLNVISEILEGKLYLSGCDVVTPSNLRSRGITAVVSAVAPWEEMKINLIERVPSSIKQFRVPVTDSESTEIDVYFDSVTRFIDDELKKGGAVLVHCVAGVSRSVTLVLAYLVYRGRRLLDAFNLVAEKRKIAWPNDGFYRQLIRYEKRMQDKKNGIKIDTNGYLTTMLPNFYRSRSRSPVLGHRSFLL